MDIILFISGELLFFVLLLVIVGITWVIENVWWIILALVVINIVIPLILYICPKLIIYPVAAIFIVGIVVGVFTLIIENEEVNSKTIKLYRSTDTCTFYDENHEIVQIPQGAIVAIYYHPEEKSKEERYVGSSQRCQWYYAGREYHATVSVLADVYNWESINWNLEEVGTTTYQKLQLDNWWDYSK